MFKIILIGYLLVGTVHMIITTAIYRFGMKKKVKMSNRFFIITRLYLVFLWPIEWCFLYLWISDHAGIKESIENGNDVLKRLGELTDEEDS